MILLSLPKSSMTQKASLVGQILSPSVSSIRSHIPLQSLIATLDGLPSILSISFVLLSLVKSKLNPERTYRLLHFGALGAISNVSIDTGTSLSSSESCFTTQSAQRRLSRVQLQIILDKSEGLHTVLKRVWGFVRSRFTRWCASGHL